jgi:hypothetical protein
MVASETFSALSFTWSIQAWPGSPGLSILALVVGVERLQKGGCGSTTEQYRMKGPSSGFHA